MKVTTLSAPIDALLPSRTSAKDTSASSFPDVLREARTPSEPDRSREDASRAERARDTDRDEPAVEETTSDETELRETETDSAAEVEAGAGTAATTDESEESAAAATSTVMSGLPVNPIATPLGTSGDLSATAVAPVVAETTSNPAVVSAPPQSAESTAPLPEAGKLAEAATKSAALADDAATAAKVIENRTATSVSPTGPTTEGETAVPLSPGELSRGEAKVASELSTPLAAREALAASTASLAGGSTGFGSGKGGEEPGAGRADFHLLDPSQSATSTPSKAETVAEQTLLRTVAAPSDPRATHTVTQTRVEGASAEAITPSALISGAAANEPSSAAATRAAAEVVRADPAEPSALARRIFRQVRRSLARGEHELTLRLDPPRLGRVDVDISVDKEKIGIRFVVESEEVRESLRSHIDDLHRSLDGHGWRADSVEIDLREGGSDGDFTSANSDGSRGESAEENGSEITVEDRELRLWHLGKTVDLKG